MKLMTTIGLCLTLALSPVAIGAVVDDDDRALGSKAVDDPALPDTFVGFYRIVSGEDDGEPLPEDRVRDHVVRITEELITVLDAEENTLYASKYRLKDPAPDAPADAPRRLDMESVGGPAGTAPSTARGIITRGTNDEGRPFVMLCYRTIGDEYPDEFQTRADSETNLFVLEPIPDPADGGAEPPKN